MKNTRVGTRVGHSSWLTALPFVVGCIAGGFFSSFLGGAFKKQPWYDDTLKPAIWPPQWFFPIVWIVNYTLMGLALWQVWQQRKRRAVTGPIAIFAIHLLHNFSFIPIVYRLKQRSVYVLMDTIGLCSGLLTAGVFTRVSRIASWLMLPYLGWLCFTTTIKVLWWRMNAKQTKL